MLLCLLEYVANALYTINQRNIYKWANFINLFINSDRFINLDSIYKHPKFLRFLINLNFLENHFGLNSGFTESSVDSVLIFSEPVLVILKTMSDQRNTVLQRLFGNASYSQQCFSLKPDCRLVIKILEETRYDAFLSAKFNKFIIPLCLWTVVGYRKYVMYRSIFLYIRCG